MTRSALSRRMVPLLGLLAFLAGWVYLYLHSHSVDAARQNQTLALLKDLKQLDSEWTANVLRSHADLNPNYDPLVWPLQQFADSLDGLRASVEAGRSPALERALADLRLAVESKAGLVDAFKAQNSLFKNSLRYVPTAHRGIQELLLRQPTLAGLERDIGRQVNAALVYSATPAAEGAESLRQGIEALRSATAQSTPAVREPLSNLLSHLDMLLQQRTGQSEVLRAIAAVPVAAHLDALAAGFTQRFDAELDGQFANQRLLLAYGAVSLLLVVGGSGFIWYRSVTEQRRLRALVDEKTRELNELATRDELTRVHNRRCMGDLLSQQMALHARNGAPLCVALLDIDLFKSINDRHGHAAGDAVLQRFAAVARQTLRTIDLLGRWGGEEFLVALPQTSVEHAMLALQRVREELRKTDFGDIAGGLRVTFSAGLVLLGTDATAGTRDAMTVAVERADQAMYRAKTNGRDRIETG